MKKNIFTLLFKFSLLITATTCVAGEYLGQQIPGAHPELFAPGVVSDGLNNRDMAIEPDGSAFYYSINLRSFGISTILEVRREEGGWSDPEVANFARDPAFNYLEPAIAPDGSRFFFVAAEPGSRNNDIWVMDQDERGWGEPRKLGNTINTDVSETFPSLTRDGTLYFSRAEPDSQVEFIYRARLVNGTYAEPEKLPPNVNSGKSHFNAFVAPDESYLIVPVWGRDDTNGSVDYYITFRNEQDEWSAPINLGPQVNTPDGQQYTPYVSPDGRYFFFMSTRAPREPDVPVGGYSREYLQRVHEQPENGQSDIYWMDAGFIEKLRPEDF